VYQAFADAGFCMEHIARPPSSTTQHTKWHIDLWECNRQQLQDCGIPAGQVQVAGICTYQQCDDFFSARRLSINSGRIFTGFVLG